MIDEEILKNVYIDNPRFKNAVFNRGAVFEIIKVTRQAEEKRILGLIDEFKTKLNNTASYPEFKCFKQECKGTKLYLDKLIESLKKEVEK